MAVEKEEKDATIRAMSKVTTVTHVKFDEGRLREMPDVEFQREVDYLSNEILREIEELKKRYYSEGFKEALKKIQAQQTVQTQPEMQLPVIPTVVQVPVQQPQQVPMPTVDLSAIESKIDALDQKLSDRVAGLEQSFLNAQSKEGELNAVLDEHKELVSSLREKLSEITMLQSSIEEKVSQPSDDVLMKIDSLAQQVENLAGLVTAETSKLGQIDELTKNVDNLSTLVINEGSKMNSFENSRKASTRRLDRKFKSMAKKLEDFKKIRKQLRAQSKRITSLSETSVDKGRFSKALKSVKTASVTIGKKKAKKKVGTPKTLPKRTKTVMKRSSAKKAVNASSKRQEISISTPASAKVEIETNKK